MTAVTTALVPEDARSKAFGTAKYTQDIYPQGMLHGVVVRSPFAAARIAHVDRETAARTEGVICVLAGADVPDSRYGIVTRDEPILAGEIVRYVGEPVALVAATTKRAAERAAARLVVEYEELPVVISIEDALLKDAPSVHAGRPNLQEPVTISRGDARKVLSSADIAVETSYRSHRVHQSYIEPRATLAELDETGGLIVTTTSQAPFEVRRGLAHLFGLPLSRVRVRVPTLGGGFGGKLHLGVAPCAAALCLATRRPVQIVCSREDELQASNPRESSIIRLRSAVDPEGRLLAREATIYLDSGAYSYDTPIIAEVAALQACGPYFVPAVEVLSAAVHTNTTPTGSMRGPSGPQLVYAVEMHMEAIASHLGINSIELRRRNILHAGDRGPTGQLLSNGAMTDCLEAVTGEIDRWKNDGVEAANPEERPLRRGYGIACAWWMTAPGASAASVSMNEDGSALIHTGGTEIGTGAVIGGVNGILATELGLSAEKIAVICGDTGRGPYDLGSEGSRTFYGVGNAVRRAALEVREILAREVAEEFEANPEDLVFQEDRIAVAGSPNRFLTVADAVGKAMQREGPVVGTGRFQAPPVEYESACTNARFLPYYNEPSFHCHGAEVDIDVETGHVFVRRYVAAHDVGPVVNRSRVRGQIEGGVVQGLGYALFEEVLIDEAGRTKNSSFVDYRVPTVADIPGEITTITLEDVPSDHGPYGAKGIGEAPVILPAAVIGTALFDTFNRAPNELPLSAERVAQLGSVGEALEGEEGGLNNLGDA